MRFSKITVEKWQQFETIEIDFDRRLTILTGANGSGKTSILNVLAKHANWQQPSYSIPKKQKRSGVVSFITRFFDGEDKSSLPKIGELHYADGSKAELHTQTSNSAEYHLNITDQKEVECFYIPSHRSVPKYQALTNVPTIKKDKKTAFDEVFNTNKERYFGRSKVSSSYFMKAALIGWATHGYGVQTPTGNIIMASDVEQAAYFEGFPEVLKKILPKSLGFERLEIRNSELVFVCNGGNDEFILETASGGIYALIDMAWQIYMYSTEEQKHFTVIIDEVENHLHPSMQRQVLGDFLEAFPNVCFIVSTHSPLIVGSVIASRTSGLMKGLRFVPKASLIASHSSGSKRRFRALFTFSFLSFVRGFSLKGIPQSCMAISRACLMI